MLRLIILLVAITLISMSLSWIAEEPGRVMIEWSDYQIEMSFLTLITFVAVSGLLVMAVYWLLMGVVRTPVNLERRRQLKRQELGITALTEAVAALATQDVAAAQRQIARAQHYLPGRPITLMLSAQAAKQEGNEAKARMHLERMLESSGSTEYIAMRSLAENARRSGDNAHALEYARKALALKPSDPGMILTLVRLYSQQGNMQEALRLLEYSARKRFIPGNEVKRLSSYVCYENALRLIDEKRSDAAQQALDASLKRLPGFAPAAARKAEYLLEQGAVRKALKLLEKSWKVAPHPELADALIACWKADKDRKKVVYVIEKLVQSSHESRESQYLMAHLALCRGDAAAARLLADQLVDAKATARGFELLAEVEKSENNQEAAAQRLKDAAHASREEGWECELCHDYPRQWYFSCPKCASVGSIVSSAKG